MLLAAVTAASNSTSNTNACTGKSAGLDPYDCSAWVDLYDSNGGTDLGVRNCDHADRTALHLVQRGPGSDPCPMLLSCNLAGSSWTQFCDESGSSQYRLDPCSYVCVLQRSATLALATPPPPSLSPVVRCALSLAGYRCTSRGQVECTDGHITYLYVYAHTRLALHN
jgi:hypothetical protein